MREGGGERAKLVVEALEEGDDVGLALALVAGVVDDARLVEGPGLVDGRLLQVLEQVLLALGVVLALVRVACAGLVVFLVVVFKLFLQADLSVPFILWLRLHPEVAVLHVKHVVLIHFVL